MVSLRDALRRLPKFHDLLESVDVDLLQSINTNIYALPELEELLSKAIVDDPPLQILDGGLIRKGYNEEKDELAQIASHGEEYIFQLEAEERRKDRHQKLKSRLQSRRRLLYRSYEIADG